MPNYRRARHAGGTFFFTVVTANRRPVLTRGRVRQALRESIQQVREAAPFAIDAWVLLPDHLHCVWTLPENDDDYSWRWGNIKRLTTKSLGLSGEKPGLWQSRFWEHWVRDEEDLTTHIEYILMNPVKHGLCARVRDWPYSSFHRFVRQGRYPLDWGGVVHDGDFGE